MQIKRNIIKRIKLLWMVIAMAVTPRTMILAQVEPLKVFNTKNGLNSNEIYDLQLDSLGKLWFVSDRGIGTYDSHELRSYTTADGLSNNTNFEIFQNNQGQLWLAAYDGSLILLDDKDFRPVDWNDQLLELTSGRWISQMIFSDSLIVLTVFKEKEQYYTYDLKTKVLETVNINTLDAKNIYKSSNGLKEIKIGNQYMYHFPDFGFDFGHLKLGGNKDLAVFRGAIYLVDRKEMSFQKLNLKENVDHIFQDQQQNIWLCTNDGLINFDAENLQIREKHFPGFHITSILQDQDQNYWVSSIENGIYFLPSLDIQRLKLPSAPNNNKTIFLGSKDHKLYAGGTNHKLYALHKSDNKFELSEVNSDIHLDCYGSYDLESKFKFDTDKNAKIFGRVLILDREQDLHLLAGSLNYFVFKGTQKIWSSEKIAHQLSSRITSVAQVTENSFLIGTMYGMHQLQINATAASPITPSAILPEHRISAIKKGHNGVLAVATIGAGIFILDKNYQVKAHIHQDLSSNLINDLAFEADSILWSASNKGLDRLSFRFTQNKFELNQIEKFNTAHGLASNYINDILITDNIFIATDNGLNIFQYQQLKRTVQIPKLYLEQVEETNTKAILENNQSLSYQANSIRFSFKGITNSKKALQDFYKYRLKSSASKNAEWYYTSENNVLLTSLSPAQYQFELAAQNRNSQWSTPLVFNFEIKAPFWHQLWFWISACLVLFFILWQMYKSRITRIQEKQMLKEVELQLKSSQLNALRNQMNPHFIFNALNSIQNLVFEKNIESTNYYLSKFAKLIRKSLDLSSLDLIPIEEEISFLENYLELEKLRFQDEFDFEIILPEKFSLEEILIPPLLLQPLVENAIKHGFKNIDYKGFIRINFDWMDKSKQYKIRIEDNGTGTSSNLMGKASHASKGLDIIAQRIKMLNQKEKNSFSQFRHGNLDNQTGYFCELILIKYNWINENSSH